MLSRLIGQLDVFNQGYVAKKTHLLSFFWGAAWRSHGQRWTVKGPGGREPLGTLEFFRNIQRPSQNKGDRGGGVSVLPRESNRFGLNWLAAQKDQKYGMTTRAMTAVAAFKGNPTFTKSLKR